MIEVLPAPGMVKTFEEVKQRVLLVAPYVSWIHIDIADHTLVPNETCRDVSRWIELPSNLKYEAHLMVAHPEQYIRPLVDAGFSRLIAHVECEDPRRFLEEAQYEEVEVGLALDGPSSLDMLEPFLEEIDVALLMGIEAGFSGQPFQEETIEKIKSLLHHYPETIVEVDGGVNEETGKLVVDAGVTRLAVTSFLFEKHTKETIEQAIRQLEELK